MEQDLAVLIAKAALCDIASVEARDAELARTEQEERDRAAKVEADRLARERAEAARAAEARERRSGATGSAVARLFLAIPYAIVYGFAFGADHAEQPNFDGSLIWDFLIAIAASTAVGVAACWLCDVLLGRPQRWLFAVLAAASFAIAWNAFGGSGGSAGGPIIVVAVTYLVGAVITKVVPAVADSSTFEAPLTAVQGTWIGRVNLIGWVGFPLAAAQLVASYSAQAGISVHGLVSDLYGDSWTWFASLLNWFDGIANLTDSATVYWMVPGMVAILVVSAFRQTRVNFNGHFSRAEAIIIVVAVVGMVLGILLQWALAVTVTAMLLMVVVGIGIAVWFFMILND